MPELFDLVVAGGGLGGASLAKCIAESGARVLVLERDCQFKDRIRGEFLSPWGVAEATELGIGGLLHERCAHAVQWVDFFSRSILTAHRDVAATNPYQLPCLALYHPAMQEVLIDAAGNAGAVVRRGVLSKKFGQGVRLSSLLDIMASAERFGRGLLSERTVGRPL